MRLLMIVDFSECCMETSIILDPRNLDERSLQARNCARSGNNAHTFGGSG